MDPTNLPITAENYEQVLEDLLLRYGATMDEPMGPALERAFEAGDPEALPLVKFIVSRAWAERMGRP